MNGSFCVIAKQASNEILVSDCSSVHQRGAVMKKVYAFAETLGLVPEEISGVLRHE